MSPLYKYARLYADYAKILQHSFKSVLLLNQCYMVVTYLKIVLDWWEKKLFLFLRPGADGTRGTGGRFWQYQKQNLSLYFFVPHPSDFWNFQSEGYL